MKVVDNRKAGKLSSWAGLRRLEARFLRSRRVVLVFALLGLLIQAALGVPVPLLQGMAVDRLAAAWHPGGTGSSPAPAVALLVGAMLACHLARMALGWKVAATMSTATLEFVRELTDTMHRKLQRLSTGYFDREPTGRIMTRLTSDVGSLMIFLSGGSLQLVSDLVLAALISVLLFWIQWQLALVGLLAMPLFVLNHRAFSRSIHDLSHAMREQVASLYSLLSERVSAVRVVRSFVGEEAEIAEFARRIDAQREVGWTSMRTVACQGAWATVINGLGTVGVLACGAALVQRGEMTVGELIAVAALLAQLYQPIVRLTGAQAMIAATLVAVDRIVEVLDEPEVPCPADAIRPARRPEGRLVFRDVRFAYPGGPKVLDDITLAIEPGMTLGVLGASGSGKSTLLSLVPRIHDLPEGHGTITLDGHDVRRLELSALRRSAVLVPQQAVLFEGTIRSNLLYASRDAVTDDDIRRALEISDLADWIARLPEGLDTPVGERGQTLSGGQRQRLALARALVADPALLLLDDCTSALDAATEARIQAALRQTRQGRTQVVVSQKVSSVVHADWIIVLDAGRIVEQGTHESLLREGGLYATTCRHQAGGMVYADDPVPGRPYLTSITTVCRENAAGRPR